MLQGGTGCLLLKKYLNRSQYFECNLFAASAEEEEGVVHDFHPKSTEDARWAAP